MAKFKEQSFLARFPQQFLALFRKNVLVAWRNSTSTLLRLLAPCIFILLVLLLDYAVRADANRSESLREVRTPSRNAVEGIPECESDIYITSPCKDFIYSPTSSPEVQEIVKSIRENNAGRPISEDRVQGFQSIDAANAWLLENPERAGGGLHFHVDGPKAIDFTLQINATIKFFRGKSQNPVDYIGLPLQVAAHRETSRHLAKGHEDGPKQLEQFEVGWKNFPHPSTESESLIGAFMSIFLFVASMFSFVITMTSIIGERESKVLQALQTMGMMRTSYWLSWLTWEFIFSFIVTLVCIAFGAICQINFFLKNNFGNVFFTLFTFYLGMVGFSYFFASFIRKTSTAIFLGFAVFLIGFIQYMVQLAFNPYQEQYYSKWGYALTIVFSALPWAPFGKAIQDLGNATTQDDDKGISWDDRYNYCKWDDGCRMPLPLVWGVEIILFVLYSLLGIYLTSVLPDASGVRDPPHFFLMPSFWSPRKYHAQEVVQHQEQAPEPVRTDSDVAAEKAKMHDRLARGASSLASHAQASAPGAPPPGPAPAIEMFGMQRRFGDFWAVCGNWLEIHNNQLFCLLGPNGAGKSTTINMLIGALPATGGDAVMVGESIRSPGGLQEIRAQMGVCPQFDILWGELTAREHMVLFGNIKGLATSEIVMEEAESLLSEVNLTYAASQRAGTFSGGMKRRLSVAVALLGDPRIVFLDEPTTGMDPVSRRQVWDIIERAKRGRAVVLTTHSMEEADILGDRIGIMARGSLRCLGTSLHLKQKFGAGYQVAVSVAGVDDTHAVTAARSARVKAFMRDNHGLEPLSETKAYITYLIERSNESQLPELLKSLEDNEASLEVSDVQIALTTLEEVFLNIAKRAEIEHASGRTMEVELPSGRMVSVVVGQEEAIDPHDQSRFRISWGQDHDGNLCVSNVMYVT